MTQMQATQILNPCNNALRSQSASIEPGRGKYSKYLPFAFTEHGVAMLCGILSSPKAVEINIAIIRAFISLRHFALSFAELAEKVILHDRELEEIHELLRWLGEENQARYNENQSLHSRDITNLEWAERVKIGFQKDP